VLEISINWRLMKQKQAPVLESRDTIVYADGVRFIDMNVKAPGERQERNQILILTGRWLIIHWWKNP
jgi:hypothetical protein